MDASLVKYQMEADVTARRFNVVFRAKSGNLIIGIAPWTAVRLLETDIDTSHPDNVATIIK